MKLCLLPLLLLPCAHGAEATRLRIDAGIGGHPWGTPMEVVGRDGRELTGQVRIDEHTIIQQYRDGTSFRFEHGRLAGAYVRPVIRDTVISEYKEEPPFRTEDGFRYGMTFAEARRIIGSGAEEPPEYLDDGYAVELEHVVMTLVCIRVRDDAASPLRTELIDWRVHVKGSPPPDSGPAR
jgi:hypothetical protein